MFDIAWSEFLVVAVVALVVVGPRDLPGLLRTVGKTVASLRRMAGEFQSQFNEAMREAELDDLKNEVTGLKDKASKLVGASPFQIARDELKNALTNTAKPAPSALAGEAPKPDGDAPAPSALAPVIEPTPEPPAPAAADFAPAPRQDAPVAAAKKPATARKPSVRTATNGKTAAAAKPKPAAKTAAKSPVAPKPRSKPKPPGASA
ncbi:Sec-independent protein translocase protein TatB [Methylopila sp. M107]|uniref:Sec-independent protein translocase protein TatB n=1 Tax=Methylopila sp. M107 TaxID=1101190 RepID=UPI0003760276|nr:Sec-independent protein translocase protein TatB [Methylopila sp. M107]